MIRTAARRPYASRAALVAAVLAGMGTVAQAQLGGSVTAASDYRFRGVSMSDGQPGLQATINYDAAAGGYLGASATRVALSRGHRYTEVVGYAGVVFEGAPGPSWELGAIGSHFSGNSGYDYAEAYAGLIAERWNARLYVGPDYFGRRAAAAYLECNGNLPLGERTRLLGHAGVLVAQRARASSEDGRARIDARIGLGYARGGADLQLAWVAASRGGPYPGVYDSRRSAWLASASFSF